MPKSRKRGGEKAHRKRVQLRNQKLRKFWTEQVKLAHDKLKKWKQEKLENTNDISISGPTGN